MQSVAWLILLLLHLFLFDVCFAFTFNLMNILAFNRSVLMQKRKKVKSLRTAWMFLMTAVLVLLVLLEITLSPAKSFIPIRFVILFFSKIPV